MWESNIVRVTDRKITCSPRERSQVSCRFEFVVNEWHKMRWVNRLDGGDCFSRNRLSWRTWGRCGGAPTQMRSRDSRFIKVQCTETSMMTTPPPSCYLCDSIITAGHSCDFFLTPRVIQPFQLPLMSPQSSYLPLLVFFSSIMYPFNIIIVLLLKLLLKKYFKYST